MSTAAYAPNKKTVQRLRELKPLARKFAENPKETSEFLTLIAKEFGRGVSLVTLSDALGYTSDAPLRKRLKSTGMYDKAHKKYKAARAGKSRNKQSARISVQVEKSEQLELPMTQDGLPRVSMEVSFTVHNPAKLVRAWLSTPFAMEALLSDPNYTINWAECILDLMTFGLDEQALGIQFDGSVCGPNPRNIEMVTA
jgi:hypothetical protein